MNPEAGAEALTSVGPAKRLAAPGKRVLNFVGGQNLSLLIVLFIVIAIIRSQSNKVLLTENLINIGSAESLLGIIAAVQLVVIVSGGLDLSVGSTAGLVSVVAASVLPHVHDAGIAIAISLAAGAAAGFVNALIITVGRVAPVIATLATYTAYEGFAYIVSDGNAIGINNATFNWLGTGRLAGIPVPVVIMICVALALFVFTRFLDMGRKVYAIGANPTAARLAGIRINLYKVGIYTLSGLVAGIAGVLLTAITGTGQPVSGSQGLELESITAVLLGGAALVGGRGTVFGAMLGVALLGFLDNGLILMNVPSFYQYVARGSLLVIAVVMQQWSLHEIKTKVLRWLPRARAASSRELT